VCGDGVHDRAAAVLRGATGALAEFAALKGAAPREDGED
jgi:hypothetical protein